jgi:peptide/nickel transport system ATP-binding protein
MSLLAIEDLSVTIGDAPILDRISLQMSAGDRLGLVGESGSGKSMTALSVMGLLPAGARVAGKILFEGRDLLLQREAQMQHIRGREIGMVFQEPMTALNPVKTIGEQVAEGIRWHAGVARAEAEARARRMLDRVGLPDTIVPLSRYPHQLSGGQRQRVVIAIACAMQPRLLIADEPTSALDVVVQAQILQLLRELVDEHGMSLLLISHDLAVVAGHTDRLAIMKDGRIVDAGPTVDVLTARNHPYTTRLAEASAHVPKIRERLPAAAAAPSSGSPAPLLDVRDLVRDYPGPRRSLLRAGEPLRAVDHVSFSVEPGRSTALVGRSGCGKSTLARLVLALDRPTSGSIRLNGAELTVLTDRQLRPHRRQMQIVFQDPYGSFDPRQTVERLVAEPLHLVEPQPSRAERRDLVQAVLAEVGLPASAMEKYPHEFSGGQRQRLSIARAIITQPRLIVADEAVSALDVSIRAQILDLFASLNAKLGVAYLFITHDLTVARAITDDVLVMHEGRIVERGPTQSVLAHPSSEAGLALVRAAPDLDDILRRRRQG